jgi:hypothetical protein
MKTRHQTGIQIFCLMLLCTLIPANNQINAQSAIGQLEHMTGVRIDRGNSSSSYNTNTTSSYSASYYRRLEKASDYNERAIRFMNSGDYSKAIRMLKKAQWYDPFNTTVKSNLAKARAALANDKKTQSILSNSSNNNNPQPITETSSNASEAKVIQAEQKLEEAKQKVVALKKDVKRIHELLKMYTKSLQNNSSEFDKWGKTVDNAYQNTLNNSKEYVVQLFVKYSLFNSLDPEQKAGIYKKLNNLFHTNDPNTKRWLIEELASKNLTLDDIENVSNGINLLGDEASLLKGDPNKIKQSLDAALFVNSIFETFKIVNYDDLIKTPFFKQMAKMSGKTAPGDFFAQAKMIGETYTDLAAICYSWYSINRLTEDTESMTQKVNNLISKQNIEMKQIDCLEQCIEIKSMNCMYTCTGKTRFQTPPPLPE